MDNRLPDDIWSDRGLDGKYLFEQQIAASAMAVVVSARHLELDERVAIKFLAPEALRSSTAVSRFRREAQAAAKIKNQHVVRIIDVASTSTGTPYIVMEYLDGKDLERLLSQYPKHQAPIADAVDFILQASEAVSEGHALGIVHRDLKPANLFCIDRGDGFPMIKVLDFGISKFARGSGEVERTDRHEILGSPRYMSPEQIDSASTVDHKTDIWSLGVLLYEAVAGRPPFDEDFIPELWRKIRREAPAPLTALRPDCPPLLGDVVAKCLQKDPSNRYAHLGELAQALSPVAPERSRASIARIRWTADSSSSSSTRPSLFSESYDHVSTSPQRNRSRWLIAGSIASVVGIGLTLTVIRRPTPTKDLRPTAPDIHTDIRTTEQRPQVLIPPNEGTQTTPIVAPSAQAIVAPSVSGKASPTQSGKASPNPRIEKSGDIRRPVPGQSEVSVPPEPSAPPSAPSAIASSHPGNAEQASKLTWPMAPVTERK